MNSFKKNYEDLSKLKTFDERFEYLKFDQTIGDETFGSNRYVNQKLYSSHEWKQTRKKVIARDLGSDLGVEDRPILKKILVHHIDPITLEDILKRHPKVFDPNNLISVSEDTHNAIHFGNKPKEPLTVTERKKNDTIPWR